MQREEVETVNWHGCKIAVDGQEVGRVDGWKPVGEVELKTNTLVSKDLNISLDIILTEEEKGLLDNECSVTKRVSSLYD